MGCHSVKKKAEAGAAPSTAPRELTLAEAAKNEKSKRIKVRIQQKELSRTAKLELADKS